MNNEFHEGRALVEREVSRRPNVVTVDGDSASGKGTVAKELSHRLGYDYLDTGAINRGYALIVERAGADPAHKEAVLGILDATDFEVVTSVAEDTRILIKGAEETEAIRSPSIDQVATVLATGGVTLNRLVSQVRAIVGKGHFVIDGRTGGTRILPTADLKIYTTCDLQVSAARRTADFQRRGYNLSKEAVLQKLAERDTLNLAAGMQERPEDAIILDTTDSTPEELANCALAQYASRVRQATIVAATAAT